MRLRLLFLAPAFMVLTASCAILGAAKGIEGAFAGESDPELAAAALPALIKVEEGLLAADPRDQGTIVQTASLYVMYGNAFVQGPAERLPAERFEEKRVADLRARNLYRRAFALLGPALERRSPALLRTFTSATPGEDGLVPGQSKLLAPFARRDLPLLYWSAASILAAYSVDPLDLREASMVGLAKALLERALALDPAWDSGSLQELALSVYGSFPSYLGGDPAKAQAAYEKGSEINRGGSAPLLVTYAGTLCVARDDYPDFKRSLEAALAIDPDKRPSTRLATILAQDRARRMLARAGDYFLLP